MSSALEPDIAPDTAVLRRKLKTKKNARAPSEEDNLLHATKPKIVDYYKCV